MDSIIDLKIIEKFVIIIVVADIRIYKGAIIEKLTVSIAREILS